MTTRDGSTPAASRMSAWRSPMRCRRGRMGQGSARRSLGGGARGCQEDPLLEGRTSASLATLITAARTEVAVGALRAGRRPKEIGQLLDRSRPASSATASGQWPVEARIVTPERAADLDEGARYRARGPKRRRVGRWVVTPPAPWPRRAPQSRARRAPLDRRRGRAQLRMIRPMRTRRGSWASTNPSASGDTDPLDRMGRRSRRPRATGRAFRIDDRRQARAGRGGRRALRGGLPGSGSATEAAPHRTPGKEAGRRRRDRDGPDELGKALGRERPPRAPPMGIRSRPVSLRLKASTSAARIAAVDRDLGLVHVPRRPDSRAAASMRSAADGAGPPFRAPGRSPSTIASIDLFVGSSTKASTSAISARFRGPGLPQVPELEPRAAPRVTGQVSARGVEPDGLNRPAGWLDQLVGRPRSGRSRADHTPGRPPTGEEPSLEEDRPTRSGIKRRGGS